MLAHHLVDGALKHHLAASSPCLGTDVHHVVGREHHVFVVLHHNHRVADVAQLFQTGDEALVVALVQADARLVEDIEHVDEL